MVQYSQHSCITISHTGLDLRLARSVRHGRIKQVYQITRANYTWQTIRIHKTYVQRYDNWCITNNIILIQWSIDIKIITISLLSLQSALMQWHFIEIKVFDSIQSTLLHNGNLHRNSQMIINTRDSSNYQYWMEIK